MTQVDSQLSTGLSGLDRVLKGLIPGDNIVWQVDSIDDFIRFLPPYCESAHQRGRRTIYFRFAGHEQLVTRENGVEILRLDMEAGFEKFVGNIHNTIRSAGRGAFFIFDCLTNLAEHWYSDQMLGNFFMLTCPYLFDNEAIAYFPIIRGKHSSDAISPIHDTSQVVIDVFRHKEILYLHPLKVQQRYSSTMYMLHSWDGNKFLPVTESATTSEVMMSVSWPHMEASDHDLGILNRTFRQSREIQRAIIRGERTSSESDTQLLILLLKMVVSRDERMSELVRRHLTLSDVTEIRKRMIGTGLIGGKSAGMLVARAILRDNNSKLGEILEPHDSFYIGSDVFYTFIVRNGIWSGRQKQKAPETFLEGADEARRHMLTGSFPDSIIQQFSDMLDYFGQSPIIVRSSSLLEDNYENAFSGKYDSVFCANQGSRDKRLRDFISAVLTIYSSTMSEKALSYRAMRGLLDKDEQMSLLVQRVSGTLHARFYYPQVAGVGYSYNPYVWDKRIAPESGMLRMVFGLGTRAVDRTDDDYSRVVALNAPEIRPESSIDKVRKYSQHKVDVIDLDSNQLVSIDFIDVANDYTGSQLHMFAERDLEIEKQSAESGKKDVSPGLLTFRELLKNSEFVGNMREMMSTLQEAYSCSVDIEFTANFFENGSYKINLVQCRPLPVKSSENVPKLPSGISEKQHVLEAAGAVIGRSRAESLNYIIYIVPSEYSNLTIRDRYSVARLIGKLIHHEKLNGLSSIMLIGPGRWGSSIPSLGVPVSFTEISAVSILCEIVAMNENIIPEVSLGTHFFNDLVENDILYLALFPDIEGNGLNERYIIDAPNCLLELLPSASKYTDVIRIINSADTRGHGSLEFNANMREQKAICYIAG